MTSQNEVDDMIKRIQSSKGVQGIFILFECYIK
jgi:hypothetical protein